MEEQKESKKEFLAGAKEEAEELCGLKKPTTIVEGLYYVGKSIQYLADGIVGIVDDLRMDYLDAKGSEEAEDAQGDINLN